MYAHLAEDVNWYCFIWSRLSVGLKFVNSPARLKPLQQLKVPITKYCIYVLATQAGFSIYNVCFLRFNMEVSNCHVDYFVLLTNEANPNT